MEKLKEIGKKILNTIFVIVAVVIIVRIFFTHEIPEKNESPDWMESIYKSGDWEVINAKIANGKTDNKIRLVPNVIVTGKTWNSSNKTKRNCYIVPFHDESGVWNIGIAKNKSEFIKRESERKINIRVTSDSFKVFEYEELLFPDGDVTLYKEYAKPLIDFIHQELYNGDDIKIRITEKAEPYADFEFMFSSSGYKDAYDKFIKVTI